jgi:hypothetical protein
VRLFLDSLRALRPSHGRSWFRPHHVERHQQTRVPLRTESPSIATSAVRLRAVVRWHNWQIWQHKKSLAHPHKDERDAQN